MINLNERYKSLRLNTMGENGKPLTVSGLAKKLQIAAPRICELEGGKRQMSLTELKAYRNFFKVNFEYLLGYGEKVQFTALHNLIADINTTEIASHLNNMDEWTAKWRTEAEKALYKISEDYLK